MFTQLTRHFASVPASPVRGQQKDTGEGGLLAADAPRAAAFCAIIESCAWDKAETVCQLCAGMKWGALLPVTRALREARRMRDRAMNASSVRFGPDAEADCAEDFDDRLGDVLERTRLVADNEALRVHPEWDNDRRYVAQAVAQAAVTAEVARACTMGVGEAYRSLGVAFPTWSRECAAMRHALLVAMRCMGLDTSEIAPFTGELMRSLARGLESSAEEGGGKEGAWL